MRDISRYEEEYLKSDFERFLVEQRRKKVLESIFGKKNILEIGCGMNPLFMHLPWDVEKVTIFEPGKRFATNACELANASRINVEVINEPFSADICKKIKFDAIVCSGLLHELEDPERMLEEIHLISQVDTIIHVNVPNANSFHRLLAKEMGLITNEKDFSGRNIKLQQHNVFNMNDLTSMLKRCGLEVLDSGTYFIKPFTHDQMEKMMDEGILNEKMMDGMYAMTKYIPDLGCEIYANCKIKNE